MCLIDAHCHLQLLRGTAQRQSIRQCAESGIQTIVCCGTNSLDWGDTAIAGLSYIQYLETACSGRLAATPVIGIGWHPYAAGSILNLGDEIHCLNTCLSLNSSIIVGEIGLDKSPLGVKNACFELQLQACRAQLAVASKHRRPVVLHCVRAVGAIADLLREVQLMGELDRNVGIPIVMIHSYGGSPEGITQITRACAIVATRGKKKQSRSATSRESGNAEGKIRQTSLEHEVTRQATWVMFGFSAGMLSNPRAKKARASAASCHLEQVLLETDAPDQVPSPTAIERARTAWAAALGATDRIPPVKVESESCSLSRGAGTKTAAGDADADDGGILDLCSHDELGSDHSRSRSESRSSAYACARRLPDPMDKGDSHVDSDGKVCAPSNAQDLDHGLTSAAAVAAAGEGGALQLAPVECVEAPESLHPSPSASSCSPPRPESQLSSPTSSFPADLNCPSNVIVALHALAELRGTGMVELAAAVNANFERTLGKYCFREASGLEFVATELKKCTFSDARIRTSVSDSSLRCCGGDIGASLPKQAVTVPGVSIKTQMKDEQREAYQDGTQD